MARNDGIINLIRLPNIVLGISNNDVLLKAYEKYSTTVKQNGRSELVFFLTHISTLSGTGQGTFTLTYVFVRSDFVS